MHTPTQFTHTVKMGREYVCVAPFDTASEIAKQLTTKGVKAVVVRKATAGEVRSSLPHCTMVVVGASTFSFA